MPLNDYIICGFRLIDDIFHHSTKKKPIRNGGYLPTLSDSVVITMQLIGSFSLLRTIRRSGSILRVIFSVTFQSFSSLVIKPLISRQLGYGILSV